MGVRTHLVTAHHALPLMLRSAGSPGLVVEMTDGTFDANREFRAGVGFYYDFVKACVQRIVVGLTHELRDLPVTALAVTPGWIRSEAMLEHFGVREETWRDAVEKVPGSRSASHRPTSAAASPPWRPTRATPGGRVSRSRRTTWRRRTT